MADERHLTTAFQRRHGIRAVHAGIIHGAVASRDDAATLPRGHQPAVGTNAAVATRWRGSNAGPLETSSGPRPRVLVDSSPGGPEVGGAAGDYGLFAGGGEIDPTLSPALRFRRRGASWPCSRSLALRADRTGRASPA